MDLAVCALIETENGFCVWIFSLTMITTKTIIIMVITMILLV